jgi:hypothetical protein
MVGSQPLTERPDLGSRQRRHAATMGQPTDVDIQRAAIAIEQQRVIPSYLAIHRHRLGHLRTAGYPRFPSNPH